MAEEILDPGPVAFGGVEFVPMRHTETGGIMDAPPQMVAHWEQRGWETYEKPAPPEVAEVAERANLRMKRDVLDQLARDAGVIDPEDFGSKQEVIDAIEALAPITNPPSSSDGDTSEED